MRAQLQRTRKISFSNSLHLLDELIQRNNKAGRLHFTTDKQTAYQNAEVIFICVGTPSDENGRADMKYILAAARDIGDAIEAAPGETGGAADERRAKIIIVKSTVPVGTNARVKAEIAKRTNKPFKMASTLGTGLLAVVKVT